MEYGLIGEKLCHSYSKYIHSLIGDYEYELCEISPCAIDSFMKSKDFKAVNVTIPYKKTVIPYLDEIDEPSMKIGAINCIRNDSGYLVGHNSDFDGMKELFIKNGIDAKGKKALILGSGGTSMTAKAVLDSLGADEIIKVSRSERDGFVTYEQAEKLHEDAEIIVNTTPVGMFPDIYKSPVNLDFFPKLEAVVDVIYNPLKTKLVSEAQKRNIKATGGLYMLVSQAVHAYAFFMKKDVENGLTDKIYETVLREIQNIVLIGMPSSGKTTISKIISEKLHREFVDIDSEIKLREGCEITDIFAEKGEEYFRRTESEVTSEIAKKSGVVIATGGGIVLNRINIDMLKMNGTTVFIDRPLEKLLPTEDRPCANSKEKIEALYSYRYPLYNEYADYTVQITDNAEENADRIIELVKGKTV